MRSIAWQWAAGSLALLLAHSPQRCAASPSVNVDLQASFASPPFVVELLETAADEDPSTYFPLLDRIAEGYFDQVSSDAEIYYRFLALLDDEKLITAPEALSSFKLALSIRNAAPRIQAHYQFYNTSVKTASRENVECETWLELHGKQFCDPAMDKEDGKLNAASISQTLPFDRILNQAAGIPVTLYADVTSKHFRKFHKILAKSARDGKVAYRVRYQPPRTMSSSPLTMSGYGVELALKRTDYIVIDDRVKSSASVAGDSDANVVHEEDADTDDIKPLSRTDVKGLGLKAAHYVLMGKNPLEELLKITQDFPKSSGFIAQHTVTDDFEEELSFNRESFLPAGANVLWINGAQYDARKLDAFSLLEYLKRERKLIDGFKSLDIGASEAVALLSNTALTEAYAKGQKEAQRYDWRDTQDGGDVIIWLNDIEKDQRYQAWPTDLQSLLTSMFPGQLPSVRKDMHNTIIPIDFSKPESAILVVQTLITLVKRKIPVRWGLVPSALTRKSEDQAKVIYHLHKSYGLKSVIHYLEELSRVKQKDLLPHEPVFQKVIDGRSLKQDNVALTVDEALTNDDIQLRVNRATAYLKRLGVLREQPSLFVNGIPIKQDDEWLQRLSQRISVDLQTIQRGVVEELYNDDTDIPAVFLENALSGRNPLVIPEHDKEVKLVNLAQALEVDGASVQNLPTLPTSNLTDPWQSAQLLVIADLDSRDGLKILQNALHFRIKHENVQVVMAHNGQPGQTTSKSAALFNFITTQPDLSVLVESIERLKETSDSALGIPHNALPCPSAPGLAARLQLQMGQHAVLLNGRRIGPITHETVLSIEDFEMLYKYEDDRRLKPIRSALQDLDLTAAISDATSAAQLYSLAALAQVSDVPDGIFESPPKVRTDIFKALQHQHTSFMVGDNSTAVVQLVAALDPASETAQRWVPVLKVLTELYGVSLKVYMNPKDVLEELPVKRFYRYVLKSEPTFDAEGVLTGGAASFDHLPAKALLTLGMDVPPAWLVTSKDSIYDLDNIKLSSMNRERKVEATYQLESILIEGHSRDTTSDAPPRGIQLVLSTPLQPHLADTLIMANLGYFQFKANPGYYHIALKPGASQKIFNLESLGSLGYEEQYGDEALDVALLSFQGLTLYPRLSRKPGMEEEDVLEPTADSASDLVHQGSKLVGSLLEKAGLGKVIRPKATQADINIFSVASGHLYERMLSIMMVSVMRHTNKTVKFWFIEQFLSPSFKSFVPALAQEYGFQYEMVTYKWPHWLRAQNEKQREIWGYKILFLDVLFPLDLDKVIFVDADQIVRTDMHDLNKVDLEGAPYGFTPMCDSRTEMEGYRFWKQGYWKNHLRGMRYHISALYVVDLKRFRQIAAGDRLRQQYHQLSADPNSLSNLDQDLPNNMQMMIPIHSLDQNWLWCETWCSDESLKDARTIDLCNNPETKEPKLERAQRQVPEWTEYDNEIAELAKRTQQASRPIGNIQEDELNERKRATSSHDDEESQASTAPPEASQVRSRNMDEL